MIAPDVATRMSKLLRMLTSTHDGEVLAASNRLNALAVANNVDWDEALTGSGGPVLTEENMRRIYDEGYNRGRADAEQQAQPARDWTATAGTSAEVGSDFDRLKLILNAAEEAAEADLLSAFELKFTDNILARVRQYGRSTYLSAKQGAVIDKLHQKLDRFGFI